MTQQYYPVQTVLGRMLTNNNINQILDIIAVEHHSVYSMSKSTQLPKIAYKNLHNYFMELRDLELIEPTGEQTGTHGAIKYRITNKGSKIIKFMELINSFKL